MKLDLDALQAAAEAATPGPWEDCRNLDWAFPQTEVRQNSGGRQIVRFVDGQPQFWCTVGKAEREWANAAFIALANPVAVLALIDRLRKAEAASKWMPIETAPKGAKGYAFMLLAWGPDDDKCTGKGMRHGDKFYATAPFYYMNNERSYQFRELEVKPTHWVEMPEFSAPDSADSEGDKG